MDRRRSPRYDDDPMNLTIRHCGLELEVPCVLEDLSLHGLKADCLDMGCWSGLDKNENTEVASCPPYLQKHLLKRKGRIVWKNENQFAIEFECPLSITTEELKGLLEKQISVRDMEWEENPHTATPEMP